MRTYIGDPCQVRMIRNLAETEIKRTEFWATTQPSWTVRLVHFHTGADIASVTVDHEPTPDEAWALFDHVLDPA